MNTVDRKRRQALKAAVAWLGGSIAASRLGPLAAALGDPGRAHLSSEHFALVERVCDLVIPATDTPGALAAGVPGFIDRMLGEWASPDTRKRFEQGFEGIDTLARQRHSAPFTRCPEGQQFELLLELDHAAFEKGAADSFFRDLKQLILFGYYSSELGATVELNYDRIPGAYVGCNPMTPDTRAWATTGWRHEL